MVQLLHFRDSRSLAALPSRLFELADRCPRLQAGLAGEFPSEGRTFGLPRLRFTGPGAGHEPIRLGLFAGVHGDEAAGCAALAEFTAALACEPARAAGYELFIYPLCNPTGCEAGTRENASGRDLNREFWKDSDQPEVRILEGELRRNRFQGVLTLHADDTSEGLYGYAHGRVLNESLLKPALRAAERLLPCDRRGIIDGFPARESVIDACFQGVLAAPPDQRPQPFDLIFETPGRASFDLQVCAAVAALDAILSEYRGFISYAQDL
jgi:hypothetical protein